MFIVGTLTTVANQLLIRQWDKWRFLGEVAFIACFSYFVALFTKLGVPNLPFLVRMI
ncbi:hypothetical protein [Limosilactobacillus caecicola]|uniref:hypothetical protein n=1 Tax=Limosilactobacillus caecicola TaxID=2941332 RepID=UPI00203E2A57|nr:hypothetical protein [Limosilactobacillus caecicola]